MNVPENLQKALSEANKRGLLTPEQKSAYEEMGNRGMIEKRARVPLFEVARNNGFLKGYMDQAAGISQLAARLATDSRPPESVLAGIPSTSQRIDDFISKEEVEYQKNNDDGIDWSRIAGGIVNPISLTTMKLGTASTLGKRILAGGAYGAATGASMPVTSKDSSYKYTKIAQTGIGGTTGMAVPGVLEAIKGAFNLKKYLTRPFTESGQLRDLQDMYVNLAGDAKDQIIEALDDAKIHVYGNKPTAAQAIAEKNLKEGINIGGSIARLEKDLSRKAATGDPIKTVLDKQVLGRAKALSQVIDSSDQGLANAEKLRSAVTKPIYEAVKTSTKKVNTAPVVKQLTNILEENKNQDTVARPLRDIMSKMYVETDKGPMLDTSPSALYSLSKHIRTLMNRKTPDGQHEFDVMALSKVKKLLDSQIGKAEPNYIEAQKLFKEYSIPVNQIKVIQNLGGALKNAVEEESPTPFLRAIENAPRTLKKSTGFPRYKELSEVMDAKQMRVVEDVKKELIVQAKTKKIASQTEGVYGVLKEGIEPNLPNMLSRPALIANAILRRIGKDMGPKYEKLAVELQKNPEKLADLLKRSQKDPERKIAYELLTTFSATVPIRTMALESQVKSE